MTFTVDEAEQMYEFSQLEDLDQDELARRVEEALDECDGLPNVLLRWFALREGL